MKNETTPKQNIVLERQGEKIEGSKIILDGLLCEFISSPLSHLKECAVFGTTEEMVNQRAEIILTAVNNHEKLVDVLKKLLEIRTPDRNVSRAEMNRAWENARDILTNLNK